MIRAGRCKEFFGTVRSPWGKPLRRMTLGLARATIPAMRYAFLGALSGLIGVAAGAFGAHALRGRVEDALLAAFETAARYQLVHALALVAVDLIMPRASGKLARIAGLLFVAGTVLFCGSLYALALTGVRAWGAVTPFGGLCFMAGWIALAFAVRARSDWW